jgi:hypothetical protein
LIGTIIPIYKNKNDATCPSNYMPITLLSCLGKLFTSIISKRMYAYSDMYEVLHENQARFRAEYSTLDHIFTLHCLIDKYTTFSTERIVALRSVKKKNSRRATISQLRVSTFIIFSFKGGEGVLMKSI